MTSTPDTSTARDETVAAAWIKRPARVVTVSTGVVHVAAFDRPLCGTRQAARTTTSGIAVTCTLCGAK